MKQPVFKWLFAMIIIVGLSPLEEVAAQTNYNVPMTFSVTSTGINRFIAYQWGQLPNNATWSGEYQGLTYSIHLNRPAIILSPNSIKIILELVITSSVYSGTVRLTPTLTVPSTTINASNIIAQYTNLHDQILAIAEFVDPRLRYVIEQALAPIDWIMYHGRVLDASTNRLNDYTDIRLNGLPTLTFAVVSNRIDFTFAENITATEPWYQLQSRNNEGALMIRMKSNVNFTSRYIHLMHSLGGYHWYDSEPRSATYNSSDGLYYLEIQTDRSPNNYGRYGILKWAFYRGGIEVIRKALSNIDIYSSDWQTWQLYAINSGSYGY